MFAYPARIIKDGEFYLVSFRDFEGFAPVTQGFSYDEALLMAKDWLLCKAGIALYSGIRLPDASEPKEGDVIVEMPLSAQVKLLTMYEMLEQSVTDSELARRMKMKRPTIQKIMRAEHDNQIDILEMALRTLGKKSVSNSFPLDVHITRLTRPATLNHSQNWTKTMRELFLIQAESFGLSFRWLEP